MADTDRKGLERIDSAGDVRGLVTISTTFICGTCLKKCHPATRFGNAHIAATSVTLNEDAFVASKQLLSTTRSSRLNKSCLAETSST